MAGDEYVDVNKYAHEGGDTAPGTREQIAERNAAADKVADAARAAAVAVRDAQTEQAANVDAAVQEYADTVASPDVVPPSDPDAGQKKK